MGRGDVEEDNLLYLYPPPYLRCSAAPHRTMVPHAVVTQLSTHQLTICSSIFAPWLVSRCVGRLHLCNMAPQMKGSGFLDTQPNESGTNAAHAEHHQGCTPDGSRLDSHWQWRTAKRPHPVCFEERVATQRRHGSETSNAAC